MWTPHVCDWWTWGVFVLAMNLSVTFAVLSDILLAWIISREINLLEDHNMEFAQKMKEYRNSHDWTQQEVADRLNVSRKTISSWENKRSYPDIFMLVQISDLYHVTLDDLLREDHEMINNYKKEHVTDAKQDRDFVSSYWINIIGSIYFILNSCGLVKLSMLPNGLQWLLGAFVGLVIVNAFLLLTLTNWQQLSKPTKLGMNVTLVVLAVLLIRIFSFNVSSFHSASASYSLGYGFGQGLTVFVDALSITELLWLYTQFNQRRDKKWDNCR